VSAGGMSQGQTIAALSALVLILSLFLAWGGAGGSVDIPEVAIPPGAPPEVAAAAEQAQQTADDLGSLSGWESQNTLDIYLAIVAGLVLIGAVMVMSGNPGGLPFAPAAATFLLGVIGIILTAYVLIDIPEGAERKIGIWLATGSIVGVTIGSFLQLREEVAASY
jgi:uncharacterized membrane protein YfcA